MTKQLNIELLPAKEGDCILIQYGEQGHKKYVLIDGGRAWTYKNALKQRLADLKVTQLELLVVSHIDRDHIDGLQKMLEDEDFSIEVKEVWFNTWGHLNDEQIAQPEIADIESFGAKMGENFSRAILEKGWAWNKSFNGASVKVENAPAAVNVSELKLTILSPNTNKLASLIRDWKKECQEAGLVPGYGVDDYEVLDEDIEAFSPVNVNTLAEVPFKSDTSAANGASIAFVLEYQGKRVLFAGDAFNDVLIEGLKAMGASQATPLELDAFKISHHGSKGNVSKELLQLIKCQNFMVSTNGNYFKHPDDEAIARIIKYGSANPTLHFNYKTRFNEHWGKTYLQDRYGYRVQFPASERDGYCVLSI